MGRLARFDPAIPPELRTPPPRGVQRRKSLGCAPFFFLIFTPHILAVFGLGLFIVVDPIFLLTSPATPGTITRVYSHLSNGKGKPTMSMDYAYSLNGRRVTDKATLSSAQFSRLRPGMAVRVHVMKIGSWHYSEPERSAGEYALIRWPLWLFGTLGPVFIIFIARTLLRPRRLVRIGEATMGRIISKRFSKSGKSNTWALTYEYHPATGEPLTGFMNVDRESYELVAEQQSVVVLYDPARPGQSLIYDYCAYRAV